MKKQRVVLLAALAVAALVVLGISTSGIEKNLVYYLDADELLRRGEVAHNATVRLGGLVQRHSMQWDPKTLALRFRVGNSAEGGPSVAVSSHGAPPQMFQEGMGAVVEGSFDGQIFVADRVLVKHSNEYRAPEEGQKPKDVFGTLDAARPELPQTP